jgi:hypothetical protein
MSAAAATAAGVEGQLFMWYGADARPAFSTRGGLHANVANVAQAKFKGFVTWAEAEEAWETAQESAH